MSTLWVNTLRPRQNGRHFPDDILKWIFLNENVWMSTEISLKFVPKGQINNVPPLVQIMAWRRPGDKPLSEPMMVRLPTHICVTRPQWVNDILIILFFWVLALLKCIPCKQVKAQPPFEVCLADWPRTPFGVCANLLRDRCSCRSYNFKV